MTYCWFNLWHSAGRCVIMFPWLHPRPLDPHSTAFMEIQCETSQAQVEKQADCSLVIHEGVHEEPLFDAFLPLRPFSLEVTVRVIGYDHSIGLIRQLDDKAVIIANHSFTPNTARWSEDHYFPFFKLHQDVLIWKLEQSWVRWLWRDSVEGVLVLSFSIAFKRLHIVSWKLYIKCAALLCNMTNIRHYPQLRIQDTPQRQRKNAISASQSHSNQSQKTNDIREGIKSPAQTS